MAKKLKDKKRILCGCGQETQLVEQEDGWHYDSRRHGNGDLCLDRCFNCNAPLSGKDPDVADRSRVEVLELEIRQLTQQNQVLVRRVHVLEQQLPAAGADPPPAGADEEPEKAAGEDGPAAGKKK